MKGRMGRWKEREEKMYRRCSGKIVQLAHLYVLFLQLHHIQREVETTTSSEDLFSVHKF